MGNTIRFTGLSSGLDTESLVKAMLTNYQSKIDKVNKNSTLAQWKKDAYKEMSTKLQDFRTKTLADLRTACRANKSQVTCSQEGAIIVDTNSYKQDGTHKIEVNKVAETATVRVNTIKAEAGKDKLTAKSKMSDIEGMPDAGFITINGSKIEFTEETTILDFEKSVAESSAAVDGVVFKFDEGAGAFLINTSKTGENQKIDFTGTTDSSVLSAMGIKTALGEDGKDTGTYVYKGQNAEIIYNGGLTISSESNDIEVNGIKFTAAAKTTQPITVTVKKDVSNMVTAVKNFVTEYNNLLAEINKKVGADSAKGYDPLTEEEKEAMTESEIEKWETKIKDSILRRDSTLSDLGSMFRDTMMTDYSKGDYSLNKKCSMLSQIGLETKNWSDQGKITLDEEKLTAALTENSEGVSELLTTVIKKLDTELNQRSASTELRSYGQFFSDKKLTTEISQYAKDLITAQSKYDKMETMYYNKFTAMEKAMSSLNSQSSLFTSL